MDDMYTLSCKMGILVKHNFMKIVLALTGNLNGSASSKFNDSNLGTLVKSVESHLDIMGSQEQKVKVIPLLYIYIYIYITDTLIMLELFQVPRLPFTAVMAIYHTAVSPVLFEPV